MMKRLVFLAVTFFSASALFAQLSPQIRAELEYALYDSIAADSATIVTPEDRAALAEAYYRLGQNDYAIKLAHSVSTQPSAMLVSAKCYATARTSDSVCFYLEKYLSHPDKLPRPAILLDTAFAKMQKESCWKTIWKKEWFPQPTLEEEYTQQIAAERYNEVLDQIHDLGAKADKYLFWHAEALIGLGQEKDALKILRTARTEQELALRWTLEHQATRDRAALETAGQYSARCGRCFAGMKMQAISAYNAGEKEFAQKQLDKYLPVYYMDAEALCLQAQIQADATRYLDALATSNLAMNYSPQYAPAALLRGNVLYEVGNWELSAKMYQQYLDWKGGSADVYYKLGNALLNAGNRQQACREMEFAKHFGSLPAVEFYRQHCLK